MWRPLCTHLEWEGNRQGGSRAQSRNEKMTVGLVMSAAQIFLNEMVWPVGLAGVELVWVIKISRKREEKK